MKFEMPSVVRSEHPYLMHDEMHAQPAALRGAMEAGREAATNWRRLFTGTQPVYLTGCGTSFHAAMTAEYWLRALAVVPTARAVEAFELTTGSYAFTRDSALVAFSQSGGKGATITAAARARANGAATGAITGHADSPLAAEAGHVLWTRYSDDLSWAHTVSYTTALASFLALLLEDTPEAELQRELSRLPDAMEAQLRVEDQVREIARLTSAPRIFVIGSGPNYSTGLELALKLRETSYTHADAQNAEYFLHGPISSLDSDSLLLAIAPPGGTRRRTLDVLRAARTIGARTIAVGEIGDSELDDLGDHFIEMPPLREELTPLLYIVPLHFFSYWRAVDAGLNPDLIRRDQDPYRRARESYEL